MNYRHGDCVNGHSSRLRRIWSMMKNRCTNINTPSYKNYGGRGISICDEWKSYPEFKKWALDNGYDDQLTIDRIDVNGDYCPSNCRWVTRFVQAGNTRANTFYTVDGETHFLNEWSRINHIKPATIIQRINRGWPVDKAIKTPAKSDTNHEYYSNKKRCSDVSPQCD